ENEVRRVGELDALDDVIGRPGHRDEPSAQRLQRLVVHAVDLELVGPERLRETAPRFHLYLVRGLVPWLLLAVLDLRARLARHVLVERAGERDAQNLDTTTDRKNGKTPRERRPDRPQLQHIASGRDLVRGGMRG